MSMHESLTVAHAFAKENMIVCHMTCDHMTIINVLVCVFRILWKKMSYCQDLKC